MKTLFTSIFTIAITSIAFAQNPDKAIARVRYSLSHIQDTTQKDKPYTENMLLVIGKNASVYTSYDKINRDLEMQKQIQEQLKNQAGSGQMNIKIGGPGSSFKQTTPLDYFFFVTENKFFTKERMINNYLIEEDAPKINWKITKDTASFSGVKCKKATAYFKGRNWTAWFAPDLPFQSGPWKLNGLPGLIIEAYDQTGTVKFQFAGIENIKPEEIKSTEADDLKIVNQGGDMTPGKVNIIGMDRNFYFDPEIKLPSDVIKTTKKELDKLKEAREKDPEGFINAQIAALGIQAAPNGNVQRSTQTIGDPNAKKVINNPIELPEKGK